jgi:dual specificity phosphatase 3
VSNESLPELTLADADFVTPALLVGADLETFDRALARDQLAELTGAGVSHILDTRVEWTDEELVRELAPSIHYLHHGVDDVGQALSGAWFDECVAWIRAAIADGGVVLVHCHMGINRGPSLVLAALLDQGFEVATALERVRESRPIAVIDYADDVLQWHHGHKSTSPEQVAADHRALAEWRKHHHLDVQEVIRGKRQADLDFAGERYPRLRVLRGYLDALGGTRLDLGEEGRIYFTLNDMAGDAHIDPDGTRISGSLQVAALRDPEGAAKAAAWAAKQPTLTSAVLEFVGDPGAGSAVRLRFERVVNDQLGLDDPLLTESESVARSWAVYAAGVRGPVKFDD